MELAHCHVTLVMGMSGSVTVAIISVPTLGSITDSVTVPISSTSVTLMVTMTVALRPDGSFAVTSTV